MLMCAARLGYKKKDGQSLQQAQRGSIVVFLLYISFELAFTIISVVNFMPVLIDNAPVPRLLLVLNMLRFFLALFRVEWKHLTQTHNTRKLIKNQIQTARLNLATRFLRRYYWGSLIIAISFVLLLVVGNMIITYPKMSANDLAHFVEKMVCLLGTPLQIIIPSLLAVVDTVLVFIGYECMFETKRIKE